jgi:DNA-binding transcriptional LysR family regulator
MYNITFQQIETFLTIAKYQNLSKVAEAMYISQPALSKTLQRFEEGIGIKLFSRGNQGVTLTSEGRYLYSVLEPLYGSLLHAFKTARLIAEAPPKSLRVVLPPIFDISEVFKEAKRYLHQFEEEHTDIVLAESLRELKELRDAVGFGEADVAIVQDFVLDDMKGVSYKCISEFPLYIAVAASHPLAACETLKPEDLEKEVFFRVAYLDEAKSREVYAAECRMAGFAPKRFEFLPNVQTLIHKLRERKGLGICGRFTQFDDEGEIKYYPLHLPNYRKFIAVAWRTGSLSAEAKLFVDMLPGDIMQK